MSDQTARTVLRRKLAPHRPTAIPGQDTLRHLLAKTMPRDADKLLGLQLAVTEVTPGRMTKQDLVESISPNDLIFLMKSADGSPGLCLVSPELLSGLIEVQISGRVSAAAPPDRPPTRTDGIMASAIVDRWIATATNEAGTIGLSERLPFAGYNLTGIVADGRNADLALDPGMLRTLSLTLYLSDGTKTGALRFAVPAVEAPRPEPKVSVARDFRCTMMDSAVQLTVVLARMKRKLGEVRRLAAGDILELSMGALQDVLVESPGGEVLAHARLGQAGGLKAVRILGGPAELDSVPRTAQDFHLASAALARLDKKQSERIKEPPDVDLDAGAISDLEEPALRKDSLQALPDQPDLSDSD